MRAKEFIVEQKLDNAHDALEIVAQSLPNTFIIPDLKNQDFYQLYRFGVAMAAVRGESGTDNVQNGFQPEFRSESEWGEHQIVSSMDPEVGQLIDKALQKVGKSGKKAVSTAVSDEMDDTVVKSPINAFKGYKR